MATDTPRVWLGCLAAYNAGKLHGEWVDATDADELQEALANVLKTSPVPGAEEWYIGDYDGFGDVGRELGEYADLNTVAHVGELIEDLGEPFLLWVGTLDSGRELGELTEDDFRDHYRGEWESEEAFAMEDACGEMGLAGVPTVLFLDMYDPTKTINAVDELASYINWESVARDVYFQHGNYTFVGGHVFEDEV